MNEHDMVAALRAKGWTCLRPEAGGSAASHGAAAYDSLRPGTTHAAEIGGAPAPLSYGPQ